MFLFFKHFYSVFFLSFFFFEFFLNRNDYLRCCGGLRTSLAAYATFLKLSIYYHLSSYFVLLTKMICLLLLPPQHPSKFCKCLSSISVSYRCSAPVGGVAWVFQVLLNAVVDLQEVVVPLCGVIGSCRSARLALGQRIHGQLSGWQRSKGLQANWRCLARVRRICRTGWRTRAAPVTVAVARNACDGCTLEVVGGSCAHS